MYNVIGSGTAAWTACLYLITAGKKVTLYRDPNVIVRRIGESTVPIINEIPKILNMSDQDFLNRVDGYFKYGTLFSNWKDNDSWIYYPANEKNSLETVKNQSYAYHIDAPGFCNLIEEYCLNYTNFKIKNKKFSLADYNRSDFFIDSSGQNGILSETVGLEHEKSDFLINNRAVIGNGNSKYMPYTKSKALNRGWLWSISLQSRMSYGYVYSSDFMTDVEAKQEFTENTGVEAENIIEFETRIPKKLWIDNVLFLGLSAGFIEPLNATANFAAQSGIKNFLRLEDNTNAYNRLIAKTYSGIHRWIRALYSCNTLEGEYWEYYRKNRNSAIEDINFYSQVGHQGLMGRHSWSLLKDHMV